MRKKLKFCIFVSTLLILTTIWQKKKINFWDKVLTIGWFVMEWPFKQVKPCECWRRGFLSLVLCWYHLPSFLVTPPLATPPGASWACPASLLELRKVSDDISSGRVQIELRLKKPPSRPTSPGWHPWPTPTKSMPSWLYEILLIMWCPGPTSISHPLRVSSDAVISFDRFIYPSEYLSYILMGRVLF